MTNQISKPYSIPTFLDWDFLGHEFDINHPSGELHLKCGPLKFEYIALSPPVFFSPGRYQIKFPLCVEKGGVTIGLQIAGTWYAAEHGKGNSNVVLKFTIPIGGKRGIFVIAACNNSGAEIIKTSISPPESRFKGSVFAHHKDVLIQTQQNALKVWRGHIRPRLLLVKLDFLQIHGRAMLCISASKKAGDNYCVIDSQDAGYACRSIAKFKNRSGDVSLVTANAGNDTLSIIEIKKSRLLKKRTIQFPEKSTPISIANLPPSRGSDRLAVCFFNFDYTNSAFKKTFISCIENVSQFAETNTVTNFDEEMTPIFERDGHWGFRGIKELKFSCDDIRLAAVDRDKSLFRLIREKEIKKKNEFSVTTCFLGDKAEPIGVGVRNVPIDLGSPSFYVSLRGRAELVVVALDDDMAPFIIQKKKLRGLSRSSVAVGKFRNTNTSEVALALWGGDPTDLNKVVQGQLVIGTLNENGTIDELTYIDAGTHPTDVVVGDFDGDGLDEIAVLNYGSGLGPTDRTDTGNIQIFKFSNEQFRCIDKIEVANPRIGYAIDIDNDGSDELIVSLFFEKKIIAIKAL